jgi:RNA-directed DNA polymerase
MNTAQPPVYEWKAQDWRKVEQRVFKLQKRIYQASQRGDTKTVHKLQRLLTTSWSARLLATRRVTQDNQGKKTAGVDGVKSLTPPQRLTLAKTLTLKPKAKPTRRVWIPKPGTTEKRGLGIPVMRDRAAQALVKLALEPEWEAQFEPNSYGFRPGRSMHDAIEAIYTTINQKPKFVLDADIAKCFDRINHTTLLNKLHTYPTLRRVIKGWLQAGVMDGGKLFPTEEGTPQGGVVSPLLANIALHGLETAIRQAFQRTKTIQGRQIEWRPYVIRYADDFVVLHEDEAVIKHVQQLVNTWLADLGLELKPSKTRITHTLHPYEGNVGFDFLGFEIRQYPAGKTHTGKASRGKPLGFKTHIKPSKEAQQRHQQRLREALRTHQAVTQEVVISYLNPIIRGWVNYYSTVVSGKIFGKMSALTFAKLWSWATRRHPKKSGHWIAAKYWRLETGHWDFATKEGETLYQHTRKAIQRHTKVKGTASPYDGNRIYWAKRLRESPMLSGTLGRLLQRDKGKCRWCELDFKDGDLLEIDHITPKSEGGGEELSNKFAVHRHCHDQRHARNAEKRYS